MKTLMLTAILLMAAACGGGQGNSGDPCGTNGGTCLSSCATADPQGSGCGQGLTCCLPVE
jgi:hypothetical protein